MDPKVCFINVNPWMDNNNSTALKALLESGEIAKGFSSLELAEQGLFDQKLFGDYNAFIINNTGSQRGNELVKKLIKHLEEKKVISILMYEDKGESHINFTESTVVKVNGEVISAYEGDYGFSLKEKKAFLKHVVGKFKQALELGKLTMENRIAKIERLKKRG